MNAALQLDRSGSELPPRAPSSVLTCAAGCLGRFRFWLAGGGNNAGHPIGAAEELGLEVAVGKAHIRDLHVALLRLLGLDDDKLTFCHAGRFK